MRKGSEVFAFRALLTLLLVAAFGCAPELGDSCSTSVDCSVQGDRECDLSSPGGYCTIADCIPGDCLDEGYCVRFEPDESRLSSSWCMAKCKRGCRDGYRCVTAEDLNYERCLTTPEQVDEWREISKKYAAELRAWRDGGRQGDRPEAPQEVAALVLLEACLATERAAEVLDKNTDGKFCVQGDPPPPPGVSQVSPAS